MVSKVGTLWTLKEYCSWKLWLLMRKQTSRPKLQTFSELKGLLKETCENTRSLKLFNVSANG